MTSSASRQQADGPLVQQLEARFPRIVQEFRLLLSGEAPKGFGKFFPKNGQGTAGKTAEAGAAITGYSSTESP